MTLNYIGTLTKTINLAMADISLLFIAENDKGEIFLFLAEDGDPVNYLVIPVNKQDLKAALTNTVSFYSLFKNASIYYWLKYKNAEWKVSIKSAKSIKNNLLPGKEFSMRTLDKEQEDYLRTL